MYKMWQNISRCPVLWKLSFSFLGVGQAPILWERRVWAVMIVAVFFRGLFLYIALVLHARTCKVGRGRSIKRLRKSEVHNDKQEILPDGFLPESISETRVYMLHWMWCLALGIRSLGRMALPSPRGWCGVSGMPSGKRQNVVYLGGRICPSSGAGV